MNTREADILVALQNAVGDTPAVYLTARGLSFFGEHSAGWLVLAALGAGVDSRRRREWVTLGTSAFVSHALSVIIKRIVRRPRPHDPRINIGVSTPSRLSFPSSHATSTTAALVCASHILGTRVPLLGVPAMMISRMVLGVHYPTDVAAGAAVGWSSAVVLERLKGITRRTR